MIALPECDPDQTETWTSPSGWTGAEPVVYKSFDTLDYLLLMEGTMQAGFNPIQGKVCCTRFRIYSEQERTKIHESHNLLRLFERN